MSEIDYYFWDYLFAVLRLIVFVLLKETEATVSDIPSLTFKNIF